MKISKDYKMHDRNKKLLLNSMLPHEWNGLVYNWLHGIIIECNLKKEHYEKLCPSKPHWFATTVKKTTYIQLLCNYPFGITNIMQLFHWKYEELMNKLPH
jgi:hypothetical protein